MRIPIACHRLTVTLLTVAGAMVLALVGLVGCGPPPAPPVVSLRRPPPSPRPAPPAPDPQLGALPVPAAVLDALPRGRRDPFAPPPAPATVPASVPASVPAAVPTKGPAKAALPTTLPTVQLTGVALVEGQALAFVSHNGDSGPVAVGDRGGVGGSRKPWLPRDWAVQAIDVGAGSLRLQGPPPRRAALTVQL